jgi:DNA-binding CsgD family transcriptional regulator
MKSRAAYMRKWRKKRKKQLKLIRADLTNLFVNTEKRRKVFLAWSGGGILTVRRRNLTYGWYNDVLEKCTDKQREVLNLLEQGLSTREISRQTGLSYSSIYAIRERIQDHVFNVRRKEEIGLPL